jgi:hypothetical protein
MRRARLSRQAALLANEIDVVVIGPGLWLTQALAALM